jgi:hypothetical protein
MDTEKNVDGVSIGEIEDLIHNFLIIMLEHSMRQKRWVEGNIIFKQNILSNIHVS